MKKLISLFLCLCLMAGIVPAVAESTAAPRENGSLQIPANSDNPETGTEEPSYIPEKIFPDSATGSFEKKMFPFYLESMGTEPFIDAFPLYFADGVNDMPYADLRDVLAFINKVNEDESDEVRMNGEFNPETEEVTIRRGDSDSVLWFNFAEQRAAYNSYETFGKSFDAMMDSLSATGYNEKTGKPEMFQRIPNALLQREGSPLKINMKDYEIPMIHREDLFLMPMHTAFDLIIGIPSEGCVIFFNGEGIFFGGQEVINKETDLGKLYYSAQVPDRSLQLAVYGVNELCMEMDHFYGLKEAHGIKSFSELLEYSGLLVQMLDTSANEADKALAKLTNYILDDGHTTYIANSWMTGTDPEVNPENVGEGFSADTWRYSKRKMVNTRKLYPDSNEPYFEVGNTAYLYQKRFEMNVDNPGKYYDGISEEELATDTAALIIYAHRQINRENSPIENVVIDLSNNGGGGVDAAILLMSWFMEEAPLSSLNPVTGAQRTALYRADINLDHEFDERDALEGKNLYCLISPVSFSCSNLVSCVFKSSGRVTLIGDTTGGGSCCIQPMSTAWGTLFQISGPTQVSFVKNGSYYDTDRGVDPDVFLTKIETFCDRKKLTEFINSLY